jgi:hypothetical protein
MPIPAFPVRVQLQGAGQCWEVKYEAGDVVTNSATTLRLKGPAAPAGGTCLTDQHCQRAAGTADCGPNAVCTNGSCVDPDQGSSACNPDVPPRPFPGGCAADAHCAGLGGCGATAVCGPDQYCGDPGAPGSIAQACAGDADCPGSATTGQQMVCVDGSSCVELCGTSNRCPIPTVIPAAGGSFPGTTVGGTSILMACGSSASPERTFEWTPATSGTATISTCGSSFDTVLSIRQGGCAAAVLDCDDDTCGTRSTITPTVTAGVTYTIVVEGYDGSSQGAFTLSVTSAP